MKIVHILAHDINNVGGVEIFIKNLIKFIIDLDKSIHHYIICPKIEREFSTLKNENIHIINPKIVMKLSPTMNFFSVYSSLRKIRNIDIIHIHSYIYYSSLEAILIAKKWKIPSILTFHGGVQTPISTVSSCSSRIQLIIKNRIFDKTIGKIMVRLSQFISSVSKRDLLCIPGQFNYLPKNKVWIPNAVDINLYTFNNYLKSKKYIVFIGRLTTIKGFDVFLNIIQNLNRLFLKNYTILVIGKGKISKYMEKIQKIRNQQIRFEYKRNVEYKNISRIYQQSLILINSSRFEGLPTTILEAMASGVFVISSNVGGISDVIKDKKTGFLFDLADIDGATKIINNILEKPENYNEILLNARDFIQNNFSWKISAKKMLKLYRYITMGETFTL